MSRLRSASAVDGVEGNGGAGGNRRSGRTPDQGKCGESDEQEKWKGN